jgi:hypothetical protein
VGWAPLRIWEEVCKALINCRPLKKGDQVVTGSERHLRDYDGDRDQPGGVTKRKTALKKRACGARRRCLRDGG